ncbi:MAG: acetyl-CoA decarbonylase/synthase complex subunit delta, partial [Planctomycetota bacterium]
MPVPEIVESFTGSVNKVTLGATKDDGGTRTSKVTVGGARNVVYGGAATDASEKPVIVIDVIDSRPEDWPDVLSEPYKDVLDSPGDWAKKCVEELGADMICVKFDGIHPDKTDKDESYAVKVTEEVLKAVGVPLVLWGCGNDEKDNQVMPKVSEAAKGENCLVGTVTEDNYKS